ncbi:proline dehydrogenase family protein [Desulforhabdus amnigena]|jgi:RHH-type proline utilization regulon transcriptional repressor/proline dehydrogenase/delta 1-pyrroline-5-carboxylate dehydrogenase|uniref:L-glutamate gamma-semialdehyde dehydrogenase n=1 Tax=Desulforhabdus amnigena TaxID=40218 RepID=A0A9W6FTI5_9BACT|nr:proline dehydrogenase family protein [Desulforhabdus amnigena]NLJ28353.1 bifunctional proline dehydrogenase/L-glutamate gamma-semialdehyde dehydrogenase [Deltaproteobacteria bacterium]GLI33366.1 bifunctional protein PutA [Desulforhabdus amnigena]
MASDLESRILETGLRLYGLIEGESPSVFKKEYWMGKMLGWCMQDEAFKVEMFRFVDVFPYLTRSESIAKHLREYFSRPELNFPSTLQWGIKFVSPTSITAKVISKSIANNISSMAKQFIVGSSPEDALAGLEKLRSQGMGFTVDLLGETVISEKEAEEYQQRYFHLLDILDAAQHRWTALGQDVSNMDWGHTPKINISIKPSAMYSQMNPIAFEHSISMAKERLRPILRRAMKANSFVYLDMEHWGLKNLILELYRSLMEEAEFHDYPHTGLVIQAYLRESETDLTDLIQWARKRRIHCTIRLVKGAYWDSEYITALQKNWPIHVFTNKYETDANFEKLARMILQNHEWVSLACASHNMRSIAYVMEVARDFSVPAERLEYQVLFGMGEPVRNALTKAGLPVRLYAPVGDMIQGMSYLVRRLLENTANESFLRQSFSQGVAREELLRNPRDLLAEHPSAPEGPRETPEYGDKGPFLNEPPWDWSQAVHRKRFAAALEDVRKKFPMKVPLVIGGKKISVSREIHSINPNAPEEVVGIVSSAGREEAEEAILAARTTFPLWRDTDPGVRAEYLFKAANVARGMRYELAALQVFEVGKAWSEADGDVCEAIDFLEYYGREMIRLSAPQRMGQVPGEISHLFYEPRGIAVVIAPWNFPLAISMGMTCAAIVTGNTVVYKPASQSPVIGSMVSKIFEEAKLPPGVLNFLPGSGSEIGDYLVTHPQVSLIAFTGSKAVGLRIVELASKTPEGALSVKNVIAEMGGKNAIIVDADADFDEAVLHILHSAFGYQGQKCSACSRLIVLEENYDRLVDRLKAAAESLHLGSPENPQNVMGAVIDPSARQKIMEYIEIGKKEGTLLLERQVPGSGGHFVPLTIFTDIRPDHRLAQEEIFGPVLAVMKAQDFDEALAIANSTPYALTGAVFSRSPANIARAAKEFRTGNLYINRGCTGALVGRHPFGGFNMSGIGSKTGGPDYLLQFMVPRNVAENTMRKGFAPLKNSRK